MIDKTLNNINCVDVRAKQHDPNKIYVVKEEVLNITHFLNGTEILAGNDNRTVHFIKRLELDVCRAEINSQKLDTKLNVYTAPFGNEIIPLKLCHLLFEQNKQKMCLNKMMISFD